MIDNYCSSSCSQSLETSSVRPVQSRGICGKCQYSRTRRLPITPSAGRYAAWNVHAAPCCPTFANMSCQSPAHSPWLRWAGKSNQMTCPVCNIPDVPIKVVLAAGSCWQLAHINTSARGGRRVTENLFPAHTTCNFDQGLRSLSELRGLPVCLPEMSVEIARETLASMR